MSPSESIDARSLHWGLHGSDPFFSPPGMHTVGKTEMSLEHRLVNLDTSFSLTKACANLLLVSLLNYHARNRRKTRQLRLHIKSRNSVQAKIYSSSFLQPSSCCKYGNGERWQSSGDPAMPSISIHSTWSFFFPKAWIALERSTQEYNPQVLEESRSAEPFSGRKVLVIFPFLRSSCTRGGS